ncbi:MAG: hypothetical protein DRQ56_00885 [Gammaproteobacteria bacterium]|nr:MAG: hypothetical protein DRQ56_00885 [Gammaproteobacteria bacterium]
MVVSLFSDRKVVLGEHTSGYFPFFKLANEYFSRGCSNKLPVFSAIIAWLSALFLIAKLSVSQKKVVSIIALTGLLGCVIGWSPGIEVDGMTLLSKNQSLITFSILLVLLDLFLSSNGGA